MPRPVWGDLSSKVDYASGKYSFSFSSRAILLEISICINLSVKSSFFRTDYKERALLNLYNPNATAISFRLQTQFMKPTASHCSIPGHCMNRSVLQPGLASYPCFIWPNPIQIPASPGSLYRDPTTPFYSTQSVTLCQGTFCVNVRA